MLKHSQNQCQGKNDLAQEANSPSGGARQEFAQTASLGLPPGARPSARGGRTSGDSPAAAAGQANRGYPVHGEKSGHEPGGQLPAEGSGGPFSCPAARSGGRASGGPRWPG